jgi:hypothetical protein
MDKRGKIPVMLHLSPAIFERLKKTAKKEGRTNSAQAERIFEEALP